MTSILKSFFDNDTFDNVSGLTKYFIILGQTNNAHIQKTSDNINPLANRGFANIEDLYKSNTASQAYTRKMIRAIVKRIAIERSLKKFTLLDTNSVENFLKLMLLYFGSNKNVSSLERFLWNIQIELLSYITLKRHKTALNEEAYLLKLDNFYKEIDGIFREFQNLPFESLITLSLIFLFTEQAKSEVDERNSFGQELMDEETKIEEYIEDSFVTILKSKKPV